MSQELKTLSKEQRDIIVHEAGHAAMAINLALVPVEVVLGFDGIGEAKSISEFKGFKPKDNTQRVLVLMAGYLAERRYTGMKCDHGKLDKKMITKILIEDCLTDVEKQLEKRVIDFLESHFESKVMKLAELIASNYKMGKKETLTGELEKVYNR